MRLHRRTLLSTAASAAAAAAARPHLPPPKFLAAVRDGANELAKKPAAMWAGSAQDQPSPNNRLNKSCWFALLPDFARDPAALDAARYLADRGFMFKNGLIKRSLPLKDHAVQTAARLRRAGNS